jgi:hypothetical protein
MAQRPGVEIINIDETREKGAKIGDSLLFLTCGWKLAACAAEK